MSVTNWLEHLLQRTRLPTAALVLAVLVLGLVATGVASYLEYENTRQRQHLAFKAQAELTLEQSRDRLESTVALLSAASALWDASKEVDRDEFRAYVQAFGMEQNFPGVLAMGFVPVIAAHQRALWLSRAQQENLAGFVIPPALAGGAEMAPIWFIEPYSGLNTRLFGQDLRAVPALAQAMKQATLTGQAAISAPVKLVAEWGPQQESRLVLFVPIYRHGALRFTEQQRERAIEGFAFVVLRMSDMLLGMGDQAGIDLEVYDGTDLDAKHLLYDADGAYRGAALLNDENSRRDTLGIAQRQWTILSVATPQFSGRADYSLVLAMLLGGAFTTALTMFLVGYLGSARQRAELAAAAMTERLHERNHSLSAALDELGYQKSVLDAHSIVSIADYNGNITYVNDAFCTISGYSREELLGANHRIVKSHHHPQAFYEALWSSIASGKTWHGEICNRAKNGNEYWVKTTIVPFLDANGLPERYVSARTDITASKKALDELHYHRDHLQDMVEERTEAAYKAKETAEAALHSKSEFLANMSHELRTPLHAILSYSELGEDKAARENLSAEKAGGYFKRIQQSGQRLLGLINELLDLSKMEAGQMSYAMRETDLHERIEHVGSALASLMTPKGLQLELQCQAAGMTAVFDPARIEQVLTNLLSNAIRFSPMGGVLRVQCERTQMSGRRAEDTAVPALRVSITDEGNGIPAGELETVFEKFVQASDNKTGAGGTGLGLAICREIVQAHRGHIWAENVPGAGACFTFEFPADLPPTA